MPDAVKIAVVGYGLIGQRHAQVLQQAPGVELTAVIEPDEIKRHNIQALEKGSRIKQFDTLDAMFETMRPDGVILATPTPLHLEQGLNCINNAVPLLIEKPISVTADEAKILTDAAQKNNIPLLVGHHRRYNGMVHAAKSALDEGAIGDIRAVQATCWFYKPDHYFDKEPWRKRKGAGPISVNLVHDVDLLRHFCGEVHGVRAVAVPSLRGFENEDLATAILSFENGAIATISVSDSIAAPWSWELTARENPAYPATNESCYLIGGSKGAMSLPDLRIWSHGKEPDWWSPIAANSLVCSNIDPLVVQMRHFGDVIRGHATPLVSGIEGMRSLEVVEAITQSVETGQEIILTHKQNNIQTPQKAAIAL